MSGGFRRRLGLQARRRSPRRLVAFLVVAVVISIVVGEVTSDVVSSSKAASVMHARTYAAAVAPIMDESTALSGFITDLRRHPLALGREGIATALGRLVEGSEDVRHQLFSLALAAPTQRSERLLASVFSLRAEAARHLTGAIYAAIGPLHSAGRSARMLRAVATEIRRSDDRYRRFGRTLPGDVRRDDPLPASSWKASADWSARALSRYASELAGARSLRLTRALSIVAVSLSPPALRITGLPPTTTTTTTTTTTSTTTSTTTLPGATTTSSTFVPATPTTTTATTTTTTLQVPPGSSTSWLPAIKRLSVVIVVANAGDGPARFVAVTATATPLRPGALPRGSRRPRSAPMPKVSSVRVVLHSLAAASSTEIVLRGLVLRPGTGYELAVRLGAEVERIRLQVASG
ncbi:MAG: hypothetical protein ACRD0B_01885 [Acidimicrobiales bacterium]